VQNSSTYYMLVPWQRDFKLVWSYWKFIQGHSVKEGYGSFINKSWTLAYIRGYRSLHCTRHNTPSPLHYPRFFVNWGNEDSVFLSQCFVVLTFKLKKMNFIYVFTTSFSVLYMQKILKRYTCVCSCMLDFYLLVKFIRKCSILQCLFTCCVFFIV